jgi:hypothetical protein
MSIFVSHPILDNIVFLLKWDIDPREDKAKVRRLNSRIEEFVEKGHCEIAHIKGSRYFVRFRVILPSRCKVLVQLGAFDQRRNKGGLRIELNPSQLRAGDAKFLRDTLQYVLKINAQHLRNLFAYALLNKLHVATDACGVDLRRVLVHYQHADKLTVFGKRLNNAGHVEGYNYGAKSSPYQTAVYDKRTERVHRAVEALLRAGRSADVALKNNRITQFHKARDADERMRVEVRGQKMRGLPINGVKTLPNRFAWFKLTDLDTEGSNLPPVMQQAFISMCRDIGFAAALNVFKGSRHMRKINAFWRSRRASWWKPDDIWNQVEGLLKATNLFPPEAFTD